MPHLGLENLNDTNIDIAGILSFPLTGDFYFYAKILFAIWFILGSGFFFEEKKRLGKGNILSSIAVASLAVMVLAGIGSLFDIITQEILVSTLVLGAIFIFIWYVKAK